MLVGPSAAGKTSVLCKIDLGDVVPTVPTVGFKVETVEYKDFRFTVWEHRAMADQDKLRNIWRRNYEGMNGIVFVVDSSDLNGLDEARRELHCMLEEEELADAAVLIFANKQDLPHALSGAEVCSKLDLEYLPGRQRCFLQPACAVSGDGLYEGFDWLIDEMQSPKQRTAQKLPRASPLAKAKEELRALFQSSRSGHLHFE